MATQSLCAVQACGKAAVKRQWCSIHYRRWLRHGDPTAGRTLNGEQMAFLRDVVFRYDGTECMTWPYNRDQNGHATINNRRGSNHVPRLVCTDANGAPPTPEHEAAHSCGKGHLACVAKRHLSWKTHAENMADMIRDGTSVRGERHPMAKLTEDDVRVIRSLKGAKLQREIAEQFSVQQAMISLIHSGKAWGWLL